MLSEILLPLGTAEGGRIGWVHALLGEEADRRQDCDLVEVQLGRRGFLAIDQRFDFDRPGEDQRDAPGCLDAGDFQEGGAAARGRLRFPGLVSCRLGDLLYELGIVDPLLRSAAILKEDEIEEDRGRRSDRAAITIGTPLI